MGVHIDSRLKETLREDGVIKLPGWIDAEALARIQSLFDWSMANPGPNAATTGENGSFHRTDNTNPDAVAMYSETLRTLPFAETMLELWDTEHIWYFSEDLFWKRGNVPRTAWHQDSSYYPWEGEHQINFWMSFDAVPKSHSLEVIRGSHRGMLYDGAAFDAKDPTLPFWGEVGSLPRLPDIEGERAADPTSWDIVSYDIEPGDALLFHPRCLHGGGATDEDFSHRRTAGFRFCGDDAHWGELPVDASRLTEYQRKIAAIDNRGEPGEAMRGVLLA